MAAYKQQTGELGSRLLYERDSAIADRDRLAKEMEGALRRGFELAQEHAEATETDGWHRIDPRIDWDVAEKKLAEEVTALATNGGDE